MGRAQIYQVQAVLTNWVTQQKKRIARKANKTPVTTMKVLQDSTGGMIEIASTTSATLVLHQS